jgi:hypothetical protein
MGLAINNSPIDRLLEGVIVGISLNQPVFSDWIMVFNTSLEAPSCVTLPSNVIITRMIIDPFGLFEFPH